MPPTTLSLAKTTQPTLSLVVDRQALFARMEEDPPRRGLWIQGPAGAGKTTLVASYLQSRCATALWYQLDSADADVSSFLYFLRRTAIKHCPDSTVLLPEAPASPGDWSGYARRLVRAMFQRYGGRLLVVLDNYESIPPNSDLHALLAQVLEEVPRQGRLVFMSRGEPPAAFARLRANEQLAELDADDLRLGGEECRQLALLRRAELPPEEVDRIFQASAGWVTGAILMLEYARPARRLGRAALGEDGGVLYDYIALEVFSAFDERTRAFLLAVCWSRRLEVGIAEALSGESMARQLLMNLSRNNYFVAERDDGDGCEFTLHPLLREFLCAQVRRTQPPQAVAQQVRHTAKLLSRGGYPEEAVELLADALEWVTLEEVIAEHARELLRQGRHTALTGWLEQLPWDRLHSNPVLLCWLGQARLRDGPREARQCFEAVCRRQCVATPDRIRALAGAVAGILAEMDDLSLLDAWLAELAALIPADSLVASDEDAVVAALLLDLGIALRDPAREDLPARLRVAEQALPALPVEFPASALWRRLILAHLLAGDFSRAGELLQRCLERDRSGDGAWLLILAALKHLLAGDSDAARQAAEACVRAAEEQSLPRLAALAHACLAARSLFVRDAAATSMALAALDRGAGANRLLRFLHHYLCSWSALAGGDHVIAHHRQRQALGMAVELGIPFLEVVSSCAYAQLLYLCADERAGAAQLRRVHSVARDMRNPFLEFITLLIYGQVAVQNGRASSGANAMRYALGLGRAHAYYYVPWWHPAQLADALVLAFRQGIERDYVRDFIARNGLVPSEPPVDLPDWPWPLQVRTLGGFEVASAAGNVADTGRAGARPLQLLKVLVALGGADVPASQVAAELWPNVDSLYSEKSLTINLHRLRKLLGDDGAVWLRDGRLTLNPALVYVDTRALGRIAAEARQWAGQPADPDGGWSLEDQADRLLGIYRGPFHGDADDPECVAACRERCRHELEEVLAAMTFGLSAAELPRAICIYERVLVNDPAAEGLYRGLMALFARCGRRAEAISVYERCCSALSTLARRTPSRETVTAHAAIAASQ